MKKIKLIMHPTRTEDIDFDQLYDEVTDQWELKARDLRARKWRKFEDDPNL